jgi:hypothetical protein
VRNCESSSKKTTAAAGGAAAGLGALAAVAGPAAAAVGVYVAGVEAMKALRDVTQGAVRSVGETVTSLATFKDGSARIAEMGEGMKSFSDKLIWVNPVLGAMAGVAGECVSQVAKLDDAVKGTADRLAQYDGGLATQKAMQETAEMMRDIERAAKFSGAAQGANAARFSMEQKMADLTDRFMPMMLAIGEKLFNLVEGGITVIDAGFKMVLVHRRRDGTTARQVYLVFARWYAERLSCCRLLLVGLDNDCRVRFVLQHARPRRLPRSQLHAQLQHRRGWLADAGHARRGTNPSVLARHQQADSQHR